jgi:hypothetical protein
METRCNRCDKTIAPVAPAKRWTYLMVAYWGALFVLAPLFGGIVGLSLVLAPAFLAMGLAAGTLAQLASTWTCPECKHEVHAPEPVATPRRHVWDLRHLAW